jgi:hypothetical protein
MANDDDAAAWTSTLLLPPPIPGICVIACESVVIVPSDIC